MLVFKSNENSTAIELLKTGGIIVYPTETSYGIGCDATNSAAVAKLFAIKGRPSGKGVTVLLPSSDPFGDQYIKWDPKLRKLAEQYWPGALNIVLPVIAVAGLKTPPSGRLATQCMTGSTVSVRRSNHPIAQALADGLGFPIVSTSANLSGEPEIYDAESIVEAFKHRELQPDAVVDSGKLPKNKPSTIIKLDEKNKVIILRQGKIRLD